MNIGLVLEGGGGKGAYQIGVWEAMRVLGIEDSISTIAGTSVGALNGALFWKGNLQAAKSLWQEISTPKLMSMKFPGDKSDSMFSSEGLGTFVSRALTQPTEKKRLFYATCKNADTGAIRYFPIHSFIDPAYQKKVLLASAAIPGIYPSVVIDGAKFCDGGANGDNTPVFPVYENGIRTIIVVHLAENRAVDLREYSGARIIEVTPSKSLGGIAGTLDFNADHAMDRYHLGYQDGMRQLAALSNELRQEQIEQEYQPLEKPPVLPTHIVNHQQQKEEETERMEKIGFTQPVANQEYEARIKQLKQIANDDSFTPEITWDKTANRYAKTLAKVDLLLQQDELKENVSQRLERQIQGFLQKCAKPEFHIALVGTIKAGKSALINALLDDELASTDVNPETASLTKFRGSSDQDYVKLSFYSIDEWQLLWSSASKKPESKFMSEYQTLHAEEKKDSWVGHAPMRTNCASREELKKEIKKWTSSQSSTHYFVKEVEVGLKDSPLPEGVILVDTPGLNDAVEYRSNITKDYIDRADAVLVCAMCAPPDDRVLPTIYGVFDRLRHSPEQVYIVATQQDRLNEPGEDWGKMRRLWAEYLCGVPCYGSMELVKQNLVVTSAYFYTLLKKLGYVGLESFGDRERKTLLSSAVKLDCYGKEEIVANYEKLLDFTGIDRLHYKLDTEIISKHKELLRSSFIKTGMPSACA